MAHDDRYGDRDHGNSRGREWDRDRGQWRGEGGGGRGGQSGGSGGGNEDRGFFERAGEEVRSWFGGDDGDRDRHAGSRSSGDHGYGRDRGDRSPGSHTDYYAGGDRGQRRTGPEGGFEMRSDYRRTERHADQGKSWGGGGGGRQYSERGAGGSGGVNQGMGSYGGNRDSGYGGGTDDSAGWAGGGNAGPGYAPEFSGGPRFDRQDVGSTGTHGAHPVASPYGEAQSGYGGGGGMGVGGSSARSRAILEQHERQHGGGQQHAQGGQQHMQGGQQAASQGSSNLHDPHYSEWRRRQIEELDRDYHEYRTENSSRFEKEFGSWREKRGQQRQYMGTVTEHMEVVGSDDQHVGTVDKVKDGRIILTKSDPNAGGHHHSIPCGWLDRVEDKVVLNKTAEEAMAAWRDEETSRALFEDKDSGQGGPHILERSFSGTYSDEDR
jgi:hypothetical protein